MATEDLRAQILSALKGNSGGIDANMLLDALWRAREGAFYNDAVNKGGLGSSNVGSDWAKYYQGALANPDNQSRVDSAITNAIYAAQNGGAQAPIGYALNPNDLNIYRNAIGAVNNYELARSGDNEAAMSGVEMAKKSIPVAQGGYLQPTTQSAMQTGGLGTLASPTAATGGYTPPMNGNKAVAPSNFTPADYQAVARMAGYTGEFGSGQNQAWIDADPSRQTAWNNALTQYMGANGTPSGTVAGGGVVPIGQVEGFNDYQKQGITALANPITAGDDYFSQAGSLFGAAAPNIQAGTRPMTDSDFNAGIARYMNPYQSNVVDAYKTQINSEADKARSRLMSSLAGRNSFGDSSSAIQLSELANNTQQNLSSGISQLLYSGYNDAVGNTTTQFNADKTRQLAGGTSLGNLAATGFNLGNIARSNRMQDITNLLGAGSLIQNQNQRMLDAVNPDLKGVTNYPITNLAQLGQFLNMVPGGGNAVGAMDAQTNSMGKLGGALSTLSSFLF